MADDHKQVEVLKDKEELEAPPPTYQEASASFGDTDSDDYQILDRQDAPQDEKKPFPVQEESGAELPPKMLKGKGPVLPQRPASQSPPSASPTRARRNSAFVEALPKNDEDKIEAVPTAEHDEKTLPPIEDEKKAVQVELFQPRPALKVELPPSLPQRPSWPMQPRPQPHSYTGSMPLEYTFSWRRPLMDFPLLSIFPTSGASIPSNMPDMPPTSQWRLNYHSKYFARLQRYAYRGSSEAERQLGDFPFRQVAEMKFPEFIWPPCGAAIIIEPHEEDILRKGSGEIKRLEEFLHCSGWLNTRYSIHLPVLGEEKVEWTTPRKFNPDAVETEVSRSPSAHPPPAAFAKESQSATAQLKLLTVGDIIELTKARLNDDTWTPFPIQHLTSATSPSNPLATYQRASPWAKHSGILTIIPPADLSTLTPEYIESIIIATAFMVGMQDRTGFANHLMEVANLEYAEKKRAREALKGNVPGRKIAMEKCQMEGRTRRKKAWWSGSSGAKKEDEGEGKRRGSSLLEENGGVKEKEKVRFA